MNILQVLAVCVMCVDLLVLVGALVLSYTLIKYRHELGALLEYLKLSQQRGKS